MQVHCNAAAQDMQLHLTNRDVVVCFICTRLRQCINHDRRVSSPAQSHRVMMHYIRPYMRTFKMMTRKAFCQSC